MSATAEEIPSPATVAGGRLVIVGTPIGNLSDISPRAVEVLTSAAVVACEDTRRTGRLLAHLGIASPVYVVVNEHTEGEATERLLDRVRRGEIVVLVSDAGMPAISDPGEFLVRSAIDAGLHVDVVPGPSAVLHALAASGLPTSRFVFEGFIPRKGALRMLRLREIATESRTVVLFEAPHRLERTLSDLIGTCGGERRVVIARELTKLHEEFWRGSLENALVRCGEVEPRGEHVLVLEGCAPSAEPTDQELIEAVLIALAEGATKRDAASDVAEMFSVPRNRVYDLTITLR